MLVRKLLIQNQSVNISINLKPGQIIGSGTKFPNCAQSILGISGHETDKLTPESNGFLHLPKVRTRMVELISYLKI